MKNLLVLVCLLVLFLGCKNQNSSRKEAIVQYYKSRSDGNYNTLKSVVNDSITIISGDYIMPYDHDSFYEQFKWDSIFKPTYKILELKEKDKNIIATVSQNCLRNEFLKNNPLTTAFEISFEENRISKIKDVDYINVDWNTWNRKKDSLVNWIKKNHPELDGFVHDMSMKGSLNYLKAIEFYKNRKSAIIKK